MSFFQRFLLILVAFALIPAALLSAWILNSTAGARGNAERFHRQITALSAQMAENSALEMNRALGFVEDLERGNPSPSADYKILEQAAAEHSKLEYLALFKSSFSEIPPLSDPDIFPQNSSSGIVSKSLIAKALKSGEIQVGSVHIRAGIPLISIAYPLSGERCLYAEYSLKNLWQKLKKIRVGKSGRLILLDLSGKKLKGFAPGFLPSGWTWPKTLSGDSGWDEDIPDKAGSMVGSYATIPSLNLWAASLEPRAESFARPEGYLKKVLSFLFFLVILSAAGAWWVTSRLAPPLERLAAASGRASKNDFSLQVPEEGWGEMKNVAKSFNQMAKSLKSYHEMQVERIVEERARILGLVHNIPEGVIMSDFNGNVLHINAVGRLILGLDMLSSALPSGGLRALFKQPELLALIAELSSRKKRQAFVELEIRAPTGQSKGFFSAAGAIVSADKRDIGILLLLRDITVERQLKTMKEDFFHSVAHDIGNLLTPFGLFFSILRKSEKFSANFGETEKKYLGYADQARTRLSSLMKDILDMAKLESGTLELKLAAADVKKILENMKALYEVQAQNKEISITFSPGNPPHEFSCDQPLLERVIMNLIGNALKFTPKGGSIIVSGGGSGNGEIEFSILDTGPGIPKNALRSVFGKFEQVPGQQSRSGYGLGLAICKKIVELHGGRIWVESEEGKGSHFRFRIPLRA
jgi:signal transduction histidine kinase/HAMP domain-containing protein